MTLATHQATETKISPLNTASGVYVTVHGHFYQPPRENPYLNTIERQPSASPFHDWNERICYECYRPNAFARIVDEHGEAVGIINNFEYLSFNIGPTLMSWLESYDIETYQRIIDGDRASAIRLNGHGNAIAQVYNHIILPLANEKDKYTQIRWGKEDFRHRFQREPEGMWLAETAVDYPTLKALIDEEIKFIVLAPSQAERFRHFPSENDPQPQWHEVGGGQIDPTRPYRCFIDDEKEKYIDIFFYDGPISADMGFNDLLRTSQNFAARISQAVRGDHRQSQLISVATDGETFGHHKYGTEKCVAYCLTKEFTQKGWTVTNYAHYLSINTPTYEVELKPVTAWSCSHGVERWQDDCGCGGGAKLQLKWRKPLREGLNWLRDQLTEIYENIGLRFFRNPWLARDEYIEVILDRSPTKVEQFLSRHQPRQLNPAEQIDALRLLEMQRHSLLMFTSCGWFFEEISRPEGTQILRYAARAMELAGEVAGVQLETEFLSYLALAPSNALETYQNGADVYKHKVLTAQIGFKQVAAHYAISSLFNNYGQTEKLYCYDAQQLDYHKQQLGSLTLAIGQVRLVSEITWESNHFIFAVLHLGGWDFHCCIESFTGRNAYTKLKDRIFDAFKKASVVQTILVMRDLFGEESFGLENLFAEERHHIMQQLTEKTKESLDQLYTQIYRDNYSILIAFHRDNLPVPQELEVAAEVALSHRCLKVINDLVTVINDGEEMLSYLIDLKAIASEASNLQCQLKIPGAKEILEQLILNYLNLILDNKNYGSLDSQAEKLELMIALGQELQINLCLDKPQELYYNYLHNRIIPETMNNNHRKTLESKQLLKLGKILSVSANKILKLNI